MPRQVDMADAWQRVHAGLPHPRLLCDVCDRFQSEGSTWALPASHWPRRMWWRTHTLHSVTLMLTTPALSTTPALRAHCSFADLWWFQGAGFTSPSKTMLDSPLRSNSFSTVARIVSVDKKIAANVIATRKSPLQANMESASLPPNRCTCILYCEVTRTRR